jgi:hypothetical protein
MDRRRRRTNLAAVAVLACTLCAAPGCLVNKGFLIRSDWSLELNRVPWVGGECEGAPGACHGQSHCAGAHGTPVDIPVRTRFQPVPTGQAYPGPQAATRPAPGPRTAAATPPIDAAARRPAESAASNADRGEDADAAPAPPPREVLAPRTAGVERSWIFTPAERPSRLANSLASRGELGAEWTAAKSRR